MRSYYAHLDTAATGAKNPNETRPVFRSSAIFPVMHSSRLSSRILFMGYWILKRHIKEIAALATLRSNDGAVITRHSFMIQEAKTFRIEVGELLKSNREQDFYGSLEIEFFSTQNLVFPYPAVVINYYNNIFSTVVHTAQRVYNDFEDMMKNSQTAVPESGFNLYANKTCEPFLGLINGAMPKENSVLKLQIFNHRQQQLECLFDLHHLKPYETTWIYPARTYPLEAFLEGRPGTCKAHFHVNWIFPRLLVGNVHHSLPAVTLTHTYYDCSKAQSESDYWKACNPAFYPASLMVPACIADHHETRVYFYPIYSPSSFAIDAHIYDRQGKLLGEKLNALTISSGSPSFQSLSLRALYAQLNLAKTGDGALRLVARPLDESPFPSRIKLGLDIGVQNEKGDMPTPCNICTNLQPYNPALEGKASSFRWAPVLADVDSATVWIMNSSPAKDYQHSASVEITFFREIDDKTLKRNLTLPPHGFTLLSIGEDEELKHFFAHQIGWMTAVTSNPYISMYYFAQGSSGVVGGDHSF